MQKVTKPVCAGAIFGTEYSGRLPRCRTRRRRPDGARVRSRATGSCPAPRSAPLRAGRPLLRSSCGVAHAVVTARRWTRGSEAAEPGIVLLFAHGSRSRTTSGASSAVAETSPTSPERGVRRRPFPRLGTSTGGTQRAAANEMTRVEIPARRPWRKRDAGPRLSERHTHYPAEGSDRDTNARHKLGTLVRAHPPDLEGLVEEAEILRQKADAGEEGGPCPAVVLSETTTSTSSTSPSGFAPSTNNRTGQAVNPIELELAQVVGVVDSGGELHASPTLSRTETPPYRRTRTAGQRRLEAVVEVEVVAPCEVGCFASVVRPSNIALVSFRAWLAARLARPAIGLPAGHCLSLRQEAAHAAAGRQAFASASGSSRTRAGHGRGAAHLVNPEMYGRDCAEYSHIASSTCSSRVVEAEMESEIVHWEPWSEPCYEATPVRVPHAPTTLHRGAPTGGARFPSALPAGWGQAPPSAT